MFAIICACSSFSSFYRGEDGVSGVLLHHRQVIVLICDELLAYFLRCLSENSDLFSEL